MVRPVCSQLLVQGVQIYSHLQKPTSKIQWNECKGVACLSPPLERRTGEGTEHVRYYECGSLLSRLCFWKMYKRG